MHYASLWGSFRTSAAQRASHRARGEWWVFHSGRRWLKEYGANLIVALLLYLLLGLQLSLGLLSLPIIALTLPALTVVQMCCDRLRSDTWILRDRESASGLTLRRTPNGALAFYNHFALPVGGKHGTPMRGYLHESAQSQERVLQCYAQNPAVLAYYLKQDGDGQLDPADPLFIYWDYSGGKGSPFRKTKSSPLRRIFGVDRVSNTGALPRLAKA